MDCWFQLNPFQTRTIRTRVAPVLRRARLGQSWRTQVVFNADFTAVLVDITRLLAPRAYLLAVPVLLATGAMLHTQLPAQPVTHTVCVVDHAMLCCSGTYQPQTAQTSP